MQKLREECGVFGIYAKDNREVATTAYYGLFALQHRGQESCGIAVCNDGVIAAHKDIGLVERGIYPRNPDPVGPGAHGSRPCALWHHRRHRPKQRPAHCGKPL